MSAFICDPDHFKALAVFAAARNHHGRNVDPRYLTGFRAEVKTQPDRYDTTADLATAYGDLLYQENIRSVRARYPGDTWDALPGPCSKPLRLVVKPGDDTLAKYRLSPVALLKMADCLEYQSCETEDYRETVAFELLEHIRRAAIRRLPGYDAAPWEYTANGEGA